MITFNRKWLKPYIIQKNKWSIETCQFLSEITTHYLILTRHAGNAIKIKFKPGHQLYGETYFIKDIEEHTQTYCTKSQWLTPNKLSITVYFIETPYILTIESHFKGTTISVLLKINLSFTLENSQLFGQRSQLQGGR